MAGELQFIGREAELSQIEQLIPELGTSYAVFIRGEGGIGKTRLLQEIRGRMLAQGIESIKKKSQVTIALVQELTASEWSQEFINGARDMAASLGIKLIETDANFNLATMAAQLDQVINQRPDAIIVSLGTDEEIRPGIERAIEHGICVLTFDNNLDDLEGLTAKVHQDDYEGAQLSIEQMAEDIGFQGKIAAVWAEGNPTMQRRRDVLDHFLRKYSRITVVSEFGVMGLEAETIAYKEARKLLQQHPDLKAIWTVFNEFARGITRALIEENRTDILLYSFDLCPSDIKLIAQDNSPWRATAAINPAEAGRIIVRLATLAAYGARDEIKRYYSLPMKLVKQQSLRALGRPAPDWDYSDIGWTPWLRTISRDSSSKGSPFFANEIIDFADASLLIAENLELTLAQTVGEKQTQEFTRALQTLRKMEQGDFHPDTVKQQREKVMSELADAFNHLAAQRRLVLFFDTIERLDQETRIRLVSFIRKLDNTVSIFAGRPEEQLQQNETGFWETLSEAFQQEAEARLIDLKPFDRNASRGYLIDKQRQLSILMPPDLIEILLVMSRGRPIFLDLAAEYVLRNIDIDDLLQIDIKEFEVLPDQDPKKRQLVQAFEAKLVQHITELRNRMDWLVLVISRIYPLTVEMIAKLLNISDQEAQDLFAEAQSYTFIKVLPSGEEITLHDEMQRLILEHVWPEFDPDEDRRRNDSRIAVEIFKIKDQEIGIQYKRLKEYIDLGNGESLQQFAYLEVLRRSRQAFTETWVSHALYSHLNEGFDDWQVLIDKVRGGKRYNFALRLCQIAGAYYQQLDEEQQYSYAFRYARSLGDAGRLNESKSLLQTLLKDNQSDIDRKASILNLLGVVSTKLGELEEARKYQLDCLPLIPKTNKLAISGVHNQIGYLYRLLDDFNKANSKEAQRHFEQAIAIATSLDPELSGDRKKANRRLIASASNNLGYLYGLDEEYDKADALFQRAIRTWQSIDETREIARAENAQGILARNRGLYDQASRLFNSAINRLLDPDDHQLLCGAYFHLGWTQWFKAVDYTTDEVDLVTLKEAALSLHKSREYAEKYELLQEQPGIYHQLASVLWRLGFLMKDVDRCEQARQLNTLARDLSYKLNNIRYAVDSLVGEAEFDLDIGREDFIEDYAKELKKNFERKRYNFPLYYGRMRRIRGDFAFYHKDFETAFAMYAEGFYLINQHGGFGPYLIDHELRHLSQKIQTLPSPDAMKWLNYLQTRWAKRPRGSQHIDLDFWCKQEIQQTQLSPLG